MRNIFLILALLLPNVASATFPNLGLRTIEVCYPDIGKCMIQTTATQRADKNRVSFYFRAADFNQVTNPTLIADFRNAGVFVYSIPDYIYEEKKVGNLRVERILRNDVARLASWSDEMDNAQDQAVYCGLGVAACIGGTAAAVETGGIAIFWMKVGCAGAGYQCSKAYLAYQKYLAAEKRKNEEEAEKAKQAKERGETYDDAPKQGTGGGPGGTGGTSGGGGGSSEGGGIETSCVNSKVSINGKGDWQVICYPT